MDRSPRKNSKPFTVTATHLVPHKKEVAVCQACYWAHPESYSHVAMLAQRRLDIVWVGEEVAQYEVVQAEAIKADMSMPEYVKHALQRMKISLSQETDKMLMLKK